MSGTAAPVEVSAREAEVLAALGEHLTNAEISARLFISVRTVESHVSSLLRKFGVADRRALADRARVATHHPAGDAGSATIATLPLPLTPFVGRAAERQALAAALNTHRLVTAVGPGGVGKTRLALAVADDLCDALAGGVVYVDLVPVTDPAMIAAAIRSAAGIGEQQGRTAEQTVAGWLADRELMLVLDNCEHLLDGVAALLERLLGTASGLRVLATSRAKLLVPFEWVFGVPGMSVQSSDSAPADAVALFIARATAGGGVLTEADEPRIAALCRDLDGMALAIELAAARLPALGFDGLEAGLTDRLRLLSGGRRADDRHRSLTSTLDWSYQLLPAPERAVLRRMSVFAAPFTVAAAESVLADWPPVSCGDLPAVLAGLADQSLLVPLPDGSGVRYGALEMIRQYGAMRTDDAGEAGEARARHLRWCLAAAIELAAEPAESPIWRAGFDKLADELRAALQYARGRVETHRAGFELAVTLAELSFARGWPGESQLRYEQAAGIAADAASRARMLGLAAAAAAARHFGDDALRLFRARSEVELAAGDPVAAAISLSRAAEMIARAPGLMASAADQDQGRAFMAEAWRLAGDDPVARYRLLIADSFGRDTREPQTLALVEEGLTLARQAGDVLAVSAGLDELSVIQMAGGRPREGMDSVLQRTGLLTALPVTVELGLEVFDAYGMAADYAIGVGDLRTATEFGERLRDLPFTREEGHLATTRLMLITALAGDWDSTIPLSTRFLEGWERNGRPRAGNLSRGAYATAMVHGLRGDDDAMATWLQSVADLATPGAAAANRNFDAVFDSWVLLHRGDVPAVLARLSTRPEDMNTWFDGIWKPWYAALWAEAAVLSSSPEAADRVARARPVTADNPIARAMVDRAAALTGADGERAASLAAAAAALRTAGCRYQWARTLVMAGGAARAEGEAELAAMGATPMIWPAM